ncbi:MAG: hypothetical protein PHV02_19690 [Rhodocyclaceae bacterium]|nr:hypothetical protein [Rhodocyclaceae bacterium]
MKTHQLIYSATLLLSVFILPGMAGAAPWEGPRHDEDWLRAHETSAAHRERTDIQANSLKNLARHAFHLSYIDAFKAKRAEIETPAAVKPQNDSGTSLIYTAALANTATNGFGSTGSDALFALAVGLDALNWLTRDRSAEEMAEALKKDYENFRSPSLWLVRMTDAPPPMLENTDAFTVLDQRLRDTFSSDQQFLLSWPLQCDQMYFRATNPLGLRSTWGSYVPGVAHSRGYLCGHDDPDVTFTVANREMVFLLTQRTAENHWLTRYIFTRLDRYSGIQKQLGSPPERVNHLASDLYAHLQPALGPTWYAVYTVPNADGEWKVRVANNGLEMEFPLPPAPDKRKSGK